jgi:hypothetical protein
MTNYARRISRLHYFYPDATLSQLSGKQRLPSTKLSIHVTDPRGLKSNEKILRRISLSVLNRIRRGENPRNVINNSQISEKNILKHLGNNIKIKNNTIKVTKSDKIPRQMIISENGKEISIIVKNSRDASKIGAYHNAKRQFLETGDSSGLKKFKKIKIKDIDGKTHQFEAVPKKIIQIEDRKEEPEFFDIYSS